MSLQKTTFLIIETHPGTLRNLLRFVQNQQSYVHIVVSQDVMLNQQDWITAIEREKILSITVFRETNNPWFVHLGLVGQLIQEWRLFSRILKDKRYDFGLIGSITPGSLLLALPRRVPKLYFLYSLVVGPKHKFLGIFLGFLVKLYKHKVIVNSQEARQTLSRTWFASRKVEILPLCSPYEPKVLDKLGRPKESHLKVLQVANLSWYKRPTDFVFAAYLVRRRRPNLSVHFNLVGIGPMWSEIARLVQNLGLQDTFTLEGRLTSAEVQNHFVSADIYVQTSVVDNFPLSVLDSMAHGIPSVVTRVGGMKEQVVDGQSGFVVTPRNPLAVANAIIYLLENPKVSRAIGAAAFSRFTANFSKTNFDEKLSHLVTRALK